jgi:hypothetical protein
MRIDHTRTNAAKARTVSRRKARVAKSAAIFLALAFAPSGAALRASHAQEG